MPLTKSPGGSYFPYPYQDGELFGFHLGSFGTNEDGVSARLKAEEIFFDQQSRSISLGIDFCHTQLTGKVSDELIVMVEHIRPHVLKLGLVGCSSLDRGRINGRLKNTGSFDSVCEIFRRS